jgi:hypothetical protein
LHEFVATETLRSGEFEGVSVGLKAFRLFACALGLLSAQNPPPQSGHTSGKTS